MGYDLFDYHYIISDGSRWVCYYSSTAFSSAKASLPFLRIIYGISSAGVGFCLFFLFCFLFLGCLYSCCGDTYAWYSVGHWHVPETGVVYIYNASSFFLFLVTESIIPQKEHFEWASTKLSPHSLNKQQLSIINQKGSLGTSAQKVFTNITSVKPESLWVILPRYFIERQNSSPDRIKSQYPMNSVDRNPHLEKTKSIAPPA